MIIMKAKIRKLLKILLKKNVGKNVKIGGENMGFLDVLKNIKNKFEKIDERLEVYNEIIEIMEDLKELIVEQIEKTILVGLITPQQDEQKCREYLDELAFLAETAGAVPVKRFVQRLDSPNPRT